MKLKFTLLASLMSLCALPSFGQLTFFTKDNQEIKQGEGLTVNSTLMANGGEGSEQVFIHIKNSGSSAETVKVKLDFASAPEVCMFNLCYDGNCFLSEEGSFSVKASSVYDMFDFQLMDGGLEEAVDFTGKVTFTYGASMTEIPVRFNFDTDTSNDGITITDFSSVGEIENAGCSVRISGGTVYVSGVAAGQQVDVYGLTGQKMASFVAAADGECSFGASLPEGIYIVTVGSDFTGKVISR